MDSEPYICFRLNLASAVRMRQKGQRYWTYPLGEMFSLMTHHPVWSSDWFLNSW